MYWDFGIVNGCISSMIVIINGYKLNLLENGSWNYSQMSSIKPKQNNMKKFYNAIKNYSCLTGSRCLFLFQADTCRTFVFPKTMSLSTLILISDFFFQNIHYKYPFSITLTFSKAFNFFSKVFLNQCATEILCKKWEGRKFS